MRCTVSLLTLNFAASFRHDQCVEPSFGPSLIAASTFACNFGVLTEGCWSGCNSSIKPAMRCSMNRRFQRAIVGAVVSNTRGVTRCQDRRKKVYYLTAGQGPALILLHGY